MSAAIHGQFGAMKRRPGSAGRSATKPIASIAMKKHTLKNVRSWANPGFDASPPPHPQNSLDIVPIMFYGPPHVRFFVSYAGRASSGGCLMVGFMDQSAHEAQAMTAQNPVVSF